MWTSTPQRTEIEAQEIADKIPRIAAVNMHGIAHLLGQEARAVRNWCGSRADQQKRGRIVLGHPFPDVAVQVGYKAGQNPSTPLWNAYDIIEWAVKVGLLTMPEDET